MDKELRIYLFGIILLLLFFILLYRVGESPQGSEESYLYSILEREIVDVENWNCLNYTLYYKKTLNEKYPDLDVRKIDKAGICNLNQEGIDEICGEYTGMPHTYLIVNGYGSECILDQRQLICLDLRKKSQ